jgi:site-specific DNA recombinase
VRRAAGIVRVSRTAGREGESFVSPREQRSRIEDACERDGMELVALHEEIDVSGGTPLEQRDGLRAAVEAVEAGEVEVVVVAYFDRLVRSLRVQGEVVQRVEAAGGRVLALDVGEVSEATAAQWLSGTMLGAVSEYYRRSAGERIGESQAQAIARGVPPWPSVCPGYRRREDQRWEPDPATAPVIREAFERRAAGVPIAEIRTLLRSHGIERSYHGIQSLLGSRLVLGEIHFGRHSNLEAFEPIVERETFERVQRARVLRGRRATSDRLLARLGVLRCGTCGARMVVGTSNNSQYWIYRCPPIGDCPRRVTIAAEKVEGLVVERTREALRGRKGRASAERTWRDALRARDVAQDALDAAIAVIGDWTDASAVERLGELRGERDRAQAHLDGLGGLRAAVVVDADADWERLTVAERRGLIAATLRAFVDPGRGLERVRVELLVEQA